MNHPNPYAGVESEASGTASTMRLAAQYADQLRQAFHQQAAARPDALLWQRLEYDVADLLERRFNDALGPWPLIPSLPEFDHGFAQAMEAALFEDDPSECRLLAYRDGVASVHHNAANWLFLSEAEAAYWHHAALVWMTLWHVSASRTITPASLATYLGVAPPDPVIPAPEPVSAYVHAPEPVAPYAPESSPAVPQEKTFAPSRFGLGERSVLAGNARLMASRLHTSTTAMAIGLGISAAIGTVIFCVGMSTFSFMTMNPLGAAGWLGAMPFAVIGVVLYGWIAAGMLMKGASGRVARDMRLNFVEPEHPLQQRMEEMCRGVHHQPPPRVGIFPADDVNGFAVGDTGRGAVIGVSQGAVNHLTREEMDALLAHELGHIVTGDMARMMFARSFQGSLVWWMMISPVQALGRWVFSTVGELLVLGLSRSREYRADAFGAAVAGKDSMVALLETLRGQPRAPSATQVAPELFFRDVAKRAFSTHPPLRDRIRAVEGENHIRSLGLTYSDE